MGIYITLNLAEQIKSAERIPAIKMLRTHYMENGLSLSLSLAKTIVDKVQGNDFYIVGFLVDSAKTLVLVGE